MAETKEIVGKHKDPSSNWLIFFFCCFAMVMLGIVLLFARDINSETPANSAPAEHGSMLFPAKQFPTTQFPTTQFPATQFSEIQYRTAPLG